jgi:DNA-directed RNA polymerase specialized sigma24 family protein
LEFGCGADFPICDPAREARSPREHFSFTDRATCYENSMRNAAPGLTAPHPDFDLAESALDGDAGAIEEVLAMLRANELRAGLVSRGASPTEAEDILGDLCGDCFGGERAKGGLHRLLGRYRGRCPLPAYLRHVATNRLISLKRKQRHTVSTDSDEIRELPGSGAGWMADDALISLLREALVTSIASMDPEKLVIIRLIESYGIPQKRIGSLLGWHESKISRLKANFISELHDRVMAEVRAADPWIELEWEDFLGLCVESVEIFAT